MIFSHNGSGNMVAKTTGTLLPPQIIGQPIKQVVGPADEATFSVVLADASGVTFQWRFNGADVPGATGDTLMLTKNITAADEGQYSVVVTNSAGVITSAPAELLLDLNDDGLPDSWEQTNFGTDAGNQRSDDDPDNDGVSNLDEFLDATDPLNKTIPLLRPRLTAYSDPGGTVTVTPMKLSYELEETVTLEVAAFAPGSIFTGWEGDLSGSLSPSPLTMTGNKRVRAKFSSPVSIPPGLVALWRGETDASDVIGGHDGTFFRGTTTTAPTVAPAGKVGGAMTFDGTVHVRVPDDAALRPAQITLEAWVFPVDSLGFNVILARGFVRSFGVFGELDDQTWCLGLAGREPQFLVIDDGPVGFNPFRGPNLADRNLATVPLNQWTHLAATFDGVVKCLYMNGVLIGVRGRTAPLTYDPAAVPVTIGRDINGSSAPFNGQIDEIAIYNRALTANEIVDSFRADRAGKNVAQPYFTSSSRMPDAVIGATYTQQITTQLGTGVVTFSLAAGMLPSGMTLSKAGEIAGVASASGVFDFTVKATDAVGASAEQLLVLAVN